MEKKCNIFIVVKIPSTSCNMVKDMPPKCADYVLLLIINDEQRVLNCWFDKRNNLKVTLKLIGNYVSYDDNV